MIIYDNILPDYFRNRLTDIEGKYALDDKDGNYYRFTYPSHQIAIDFENIFLGVGIPHQCDKMYFSKRSKGIKTIYKQFKDLDYALIIYFINENYSGGGLRYKESIITPEANKAVYFDSGIDLELESVEEGTQYLFISYFRRSGIKNTKTLI
jgi:hypothetical protein